MPSKKKKLKYEQAKTIFRKRNKEKKEEEYSKFEERQKEKGKKRKEEKAKAAKKPSRAKLIREATETAKKVTVARTGEVQPVSYSPPTDVIVKAVSVGSKEGSKGKKIVKKKKSNEAENDPNRNVSKHVVRKITKSKKETSRGGYKTRNVRESF